MPPQLDPSTLLQRDIVDSNGDKVGPIGHIYLDNATHEAEWVSIQTGLFGTKESFVPLAGSQLRDEKLYVPYEKSTIKDAPNLDSDRHLDPEEEVALYRYYDMPYDERGSPAEEQESGSFLARTEHYGSSGTRLTKYEATDHEVAEAHRKRIERGSGI